MKKKFKLLSLLAVFLSLLGVVACAATIIIVWSVGSRLTQANENVFDGIDKTLAAIRGRVLRAQSRVQESKISTEDIEQSVRNWAAKEASERLASRLEIEDRAEQLALGLQQADLWLETSEESMRGVQQAFELGSSLGAPLDVQIVDRLLEQLAALRRRLKQSTQTVDGIRRRLSNTQEAEALEERIDEVARLALRVLATLGEIDGRLGKSAERFADAQTKVQSLRSKTHAYIVIATIGVILLIVWMMAGQISLYRRGRDRAVAKDDQSPPSNTQLVRLRRRWL
jgi:hypothetical protein